ncbi:nuclear pore complex protein Nup153 [Helicoverpa armigera]|uniref:nuclear pore complex protein Nup153 n=1 Tax=Helicoverpa armigera TaxID=29058 RepID=UPI0030827FB7
MSQMFPENKEKQPRTSSNETNNSFVKNVTSRVSGLLPSTITKWFSSPSSSNANGSTFTAEASDSSEDEATETTVITQPPAKRMRFNPPGTYNHYSPTEAPCSSYDVEIIETPYSPYTGTQYAQPSRNTYTTPLRPQNEEQDKMEQETTSRMFKLPYTVSSTGQSVINKRKSIFDTTSREEIKAKEAVKSVANAVRDPKQPSFKPSLLGSPFYPGRTMYGGAASSYINQPNIKQESVAVVKETKSNDDSAISSSARRVMDLLESYSSPLMEARRIPLYTKPKNEGFSDSPNRYSPYASKIISPKTQELHVPSVASILRLKKKSRLMDTTKIARQIIASHSSTSGYSMYQDQAERKEPEKEQPKKMTTKVKSRLTRVDRRNTEEVDAPTPVELPTGGLQLDQDNLPKFSFGSAAFKLPATSTPKPAPCEKININVSKVTPVTPVNLFKFSNPDTVLSDTLQVSLEATPPIYTFKSPDLRTDQIFENKRDEGSVINVVKESGKNTTVSIDWQCSECWVKNKPEANKCVCCGSKPPTKKAKCSVCKLADSQSQKDKCANCEKMSVSNVASPIFATPTGISQASKWKCEDCWVSNEDSANKCACCGGSRPDKSSNAAAAVTVAATTSIFTSNTAAVIPSTVPLTDISKTDADWKCEDCWISNKSTVDKCAACGGARLGVKQNNPANVTSNTSSFFGTSDDKFKTIIQSQKSDKWECLSCLVNNESDKDKCVCCGAAKESKNKTPGPKFNFGTVANSSFKFGIDPKVQEATIAQKPEVNSTIESKTKPQSETNNNVLAETPTFTFTLPTKKVDVKADDSKGQSNEAPKMNFTFGIPKAIPAGTDTKKDAEEEKAQEVPSVDLNSPVINNENKTLPPAVNSLNTLAAEAKKDLKVNSVSSPVVPNAEQPKPTFSFGVNAPKLFEAPSSTASTMNLFTQQTQSTTVTTTSAPTLSLFKPPAATTTATSLFQSPAPLFQNTEKTNNTTTGPMFTFGSNGPSNPAPSAAIPAATEKPKFQFTFGSNSAPKTDPPAMFKSPFAAPESNVNTNAFNLPAGTTLGTSNSLPSNALGSNGLAVTNGLTGNALAGNTLGGNTLTIGGTGTLGGTNGLSANALSVGSSMQPSSSLTGGATGLFNNTVQKENVWSPSSNASTPNLFVSNTTTSSLQKPAAFTFGSATPFNAANSTPTFGAAAAPTQNMFGMNSQNNSSQSSMFSNTVQSPASGNLFGTPQPASNPAPQMPMFGGPSIGATPAFGAPNPSIPSFEAPSLTQPAAPAFNFGTSQSTGIFGFGQQAPLQQQQMQPAPLQSQQPGGVYSFGGPPAGTPQVQFSMGSGANPSVRRVRKAVRRNPQR